MRYLKVMVLHQGHVCILGKKRGSGWRGRCSKMVRPLSCASKWQVEDPCIHLRSPDFPMALGMLLSIIGSCYTFSVVMCTHGSYTLRKACCPHGYDNGNSVLYTWNDVAEKVLDNGWL